MDPDPKAELTKKLDLLLNGADFAQSLSVCDERRFGDAEEAVQAAPR